MSRLGDQPVLILRRPGAVLLGILLALPFALLAIQSAGVEMPGRAKWLALGIAALSAAIVLWNARARARSIRSVGEHHRRAHASAARFAAALGRARR